MVRTIMNLKLGLGLGKQKPHLTPLQCQGAAPTWYATSVLKVGFSYGIYI